MQWILLVFLSFSPFARGQSGEGYRAPFGNDRKAEGPFQITGLAEKIHSPQIAALSANGDSARKTLSTDSPLEPLPSETSQTKANPFRLNLKAFGGAAFIFTVAGALLELEAPFFKSEKLQFLVQAGGGAAFWMKKVKWKSEGGEGRETALQTHPYISAHTGLRYNFNAGQTRASLTGGALYGKDRKYQFIGAVSVGQPVFSTFVEAHIVSTARSSVWFLLSVTVPLTALSL